MTTENSPLLEESHDSHTELHQSLTSDIVRSAYSQPRAILIQLGLLVLVISVLLGIFTHPVIPLFAGHPIANLSGFVFLSQALLVTQPTPHSSSHKVAGGQLHGVLNSLSVILFLTGWAFIFANKHVHNAQHITTWHATFGIATYVLLCVVLLVGVAQYWLPVLVFGSVDNAKRVYKYHRAAGYLTLSLIAFTILLALDSDYNVNVLHIPYWSVVPALIVILGGLLYGIKKHKFGL